MMRTVIKSDAIHNAAIFHCGAPEDFNRMSMSGLASMRKIASARPMGYSKNRLYPSFPNSVST